MIVRATSLSGPKSTAEASTPDPWRTSLEDPACGLGLTCEYADLRLSCEGSVRSRGSPRLSSVSSTHRAHSSVVRNEDVRRSATWEVA